ncbi:hypothetical protein [Paenibacillus sp. L3-i20]|uniref:hypothetical protein n=1 Tax=Paenibacillus sp. L3-i20 TaxID=2905833 RepID=UPI001EDCCFBD|nr:hypothetical protein [Paenibacillus sp. L3-i20]GKU79394.1 hypothetical protein L3i20_v237910 [Paenibacillus sp. L3-i20]
MEKTIILSLVFLIFFGVLSGCGNGDIKKEKDEISLVPSGKVGGKDFAFTVKPETFDLTIRRHGDICANDFPYCNKDLLKEPGLILSCAGSRSEQNLKGYFYMVAQGKVDFILSLIKHINYLRTTRKYVISTYGFTF